MSSLRRRCRDPALRHNDERGNLVVRFFQGYVEALVGLVAALGDPEALFHPARSRSPHGEIEVRRQRHVYVAPGAFALFGPQGKNCMSSRTHALLSRALDYDTGKAALAHSQRPVTPVDHHWTLAKTEAVPQDIRLQIQVRAIEDERLAAIRESAQELLAKVALPAPADHTCPWSLGEVVWPALFLEGGVLQQPNNVQLELLPLSRIGQMEGKSGSLVLIGQFIALGQDFPPSNPLVVKTKILGDDDRNALDDEFSNSQGIKPFTYAAKDSVSTPIYFDQRAEYKLLWSICASRDPFWQQVGPLKVDDLRVPIANGEDSVAPLIRGALELLRPSHTRFATADTRKKGIGDEYRWYLRGIFERWGSEWKDLWGEGEEVDGGEGKNPLWVVRQVDQKKCDMYLGAIHGDLHPGNIVVAGNQRPVLIDFGWAQQRSHIAKDFVLLECNLRFLTLRPQVHDEPLEKFVKWFAWDVPTPDGLDGYLERRCEVISAVRDQAKSVFPEETDWDKEYILPLFLVALGLLRFAPQLGNQRAAVQHVLALANHVSTEILPQL